MTKLTTEQIKTATEILFERTSVQVGFSINTWEKLADVLQRPWEVPRDDEWNSIDEWLSRPGSDRSPRAFIIDFICRRNHALNSKRSDTLDVERATAWLEKNHPNASSRHMAELLHDYSLSIAEHQK